MRYGILNFSIAPYERIARRWRTFEELGFDSAWIADDLNVPGYADFESWTLLAALGRETRRMRIGTLISTIRLRHPTLLAAQVLTLDHITSGRAAVGIGAGEPEQNELLGVSPWTATETLERLDEQAAVLAALLRGEPIDHGGPRYPAVVPAVPASISRPRPPLIIAAHGPLGLRAAARHADVWNCLGGQVYGGGPNPDRSNRRSLAEASVETTRLMDRLEAACADVGRDPVTLKRSVLLYRPAIDPFASADAFDEVIGAYGSLGIDEITLYWPPIDQALGDPPSAADEARFERIVAMRITGRAT